MFARSLQKLFSCIAKAKPFAYKILLTEKTDLYFYIKTNDNASASGFYFNRGRCIMRYSWLLERTPLRMVYTL